jgi:hypothetical protein
LLLNCVVLKEVIRRAKTIVDEETQRKTARKGAILIGVILYAILVGTQFDPKAREVSVQAFGEKPFGLPVTAVVIIAQTILCLPMPWVFYHLMLLMLRTREEGGNLPHGALSLLPFFSDAEKKFPELQRSIWICIGAFFYFVAICAAWISYTYHLGI